MIGLISILLLSQASGALGDYNGMDMSMDDGMVMTMGNMLSYFHFTPGDNLWFFGWAPTSGKAMFGACVGLFLLALVERWLSMMKIVMGVHWHARALIEMANRTNAKMALPSDKHESTPSDGKPLTQLSLPFVPSFDIPRGIIGAAIALIGFTFMLAIMYVSSLDLLPVFIIPFSLSLLPLLTPTHVSANLWFPGIDRTYQLSFIFSIVIGLGVGEVLFGRYTLGAKGSLHGH